METFEARVKSSKLTKSNRMIAEYCLNNQSSVAFQSAAELAACIGVSDVSIVRFARALGYDGFVELKRAWQEELCQRIDTGPDAVNPVTKFLTRKFYHRDNANFNFDEAEEIYYQLIHDTLSANTSASLEAVADRLLGGRRRYVVGIRTRCTAATAMATLLRMVLPDVVSITTEDYSSHMQIQDLTAEDTVLFFTFGRFSNFEQTLLQQVKRSGAYLVAVTDKRASRASQAADTLLYCAGDINLPFYSSVGTVTLAECLAHAVAERNWEESKARIEHSELYLNRQDPKR